MCSSFVRIGSSILLVLGFLGAHSASAQVLGSFGWQLQPYCNRVTFTVTQAGGVYALDGFDDQCGLSAPAAASGVASLNPDGSVTLGFSIVTTNYPSEPSVPVDLQVSATIDLATLNGTWVDSVQNQGTFAFNASVLGNPRRSPLLTTQYGSGYFGISGSGGGYFYGLAHQGPIETPEAVEYGNQLARFGGGGFSGPQEGFNWATGAITIAATEDWTSSANGTRIMFFTTPNGSTNSAVRVVFADNGRVGVGTVSPDDLLDVDGNIRVGTSGTNGCVRNNNGGGLVGVCASDARFKRDIVAYANVLPSVAALRPVQFSWRAEAFPGHGFGGDREAGLIAQEVEQVLPDLVRTDDEGYKAVDYGKLPLLTLQAVKELKAENDELRARLEALEALLTSRR